MKITNELLAAYAEGKVSQEERVAVRRYLVEHPEKLRTVMIMMDEYYDMDIDDSTEEETPSNALPLFDDENIGLPMAAFAPNPMEKKRLKTIPKDEIKEDDDGFLTRLNGLYNEILNH